MHWISNLFSSCLRLFSLSSLLSRRQLPRERIGTIISNYKLLTFKNTTHKERKLMEINDIHKYCHVSTFISYGNSTPVYKQTFKFKVNSNIHHSLLLDKITSLLKSDGFKVEFKSFSGLLFLSHYIYFYFY